MIRIESSLILLGLANILDQLTQNDPIVTCLIA